MIRKIQPGALISYKYGLTGGEDFFAPEDDQLDHMEQRDRAGKPLEVCACLQLRGAGRQPSLSSMGLQPGVEFTRHRTRFGKT